MAMLPFFRLATKGEFLKELEPTMQDQKWYDKPPLIGVLLFLVPPAGIALLVRKFKLKAGWQSENIQKALGAVGRLNKPAQLVLAAKTARYPSVRMAATRKIDAAEVLESIALEDNDASVRLEALKKVSRKEVLRSVANNDANNENRIFAYEKLGDKQSALYHMALRHSHGCEKLYNILREITDEDKLLALSGRVIPQYGFGGVLEFLEEKGVPSLTAAVVADLLAGTKGGKDSSALIYHINALQAAGIAWADYFTGSLVAHLCEHCGDPYQVSNYTDRVPYILEAIYAGREDLRDTVMCYHGRMLYAGSSPVFSGEGDNAGWYGFDTPALYVSINKLSADAIKVELIERAGLEQS